MNKAQTNFKVLWIMENSFGFCAGWSDKKRQIILKALWILYNSLVFCIGWYDHNKPVKQG